MFNFIVIEDNLKRFDLPSDMFYRDHSFVYNSLKQRVMCKL